MNWAFDFSIETEYILVNKELKQPLWYQDISISELEIIFNTIKTSDFLNLNSNRTNLYDETYFPYQVEGYCFKKKYTESVCIHPKGIKIKGPVCTNINQCLNIQDQLFEQISFKMNGKERALAILSHHPWAYYYFRNEEGEKKECESDFKSMTTYGPILKIATAHPEVLLHTKNKKDFVERVNYYAPALIAFSAFSPLYQGQVALTSNGRTIGSVSTLQRSPLTPLVEWSPKRETEIEFKFFEMALSWEEYRSFFTASLILLMSNDLHGSSNEQQKRESLEIAAIDGLKNDDLRIRLKELIEAGDQLILDHQKKGTHLPFNANDLDLLKTRYQEATSPACLTKALHHKPEKFLSFISQHYKREQDWRIKLI